MKLVGDRRDFFSLVAEGPLTVSPRHLGAEREPQRPGWFKLFQHLKEKVTTSVHYLYLGRINLGV